MTSAEADTIASHEGALGFDFWLGDWDCAFTGGPATNRISKILGEVTHEEFHSPQLNGQSYLLFVGRRSYGAVATRCPPGEVHSAVISEDEK